MKTLSVFPTKSKHLLTRRGKTTQVWDTNLKTRNFDTKYLQCSKSSNTVQERRNIIYKTPATNHEYTSSLAKQAQHKMITIAKYWEHVKSNIYRFARGISE